MEFLVLSLLALAAVGAWCLTSCPHEAHEKVVKDVH